LIKTNAPILVTGAAGFIGFHMSQKLLDNGFKVIGIDNLNDYYDVDLKKSRIKLLEEFPGFLFRKIDIADRKAVPELFKEYSFEYIINLAAQAGVRHSLKDPFSYIDSNITGFVNLLEECKKYNVRHFLYASSSSVYGANTDMPFSTKTPLSHPVSLYAATKKADELIAHSYSSGFGIPTTGMRFFTAYGPWGRPDMALFLFTKAILENETIKIFNHGNMRRDFTYIADVVESVYQLMSHPPSQDDSWNSITPRPDTSYAPYRVFNIGNNTSVRLLDFVEAIENALGKKAKKEFLPLQIGDVPESLADVDELMNVTGFKPSTTVQDGIDRFISWYLNYYDKEAIR
jgi:UDP-glucuronate 4-epimerase